MESDTPQDEKTKSNNNESTNGRQSLNVKDRRRREICTRCQRPTPQTCVCEALPEQPINLESAIVLVLQHPHELKMKNRSVPILQLCLDETCFCLCVGRRLEQVENYDEISTLLSPPNLPILLFPEENEECNVLSLTEAKKCVPQKLQEGGKVVLIVLDATWKYAKEMHKANIQQNLYPSHLLRVSLQSQDFPENWTGGRFDIRTTPNSDSSKSFMSTAECIAFALDELLKDCHSDLYSTLMKPLDLMVAKWKSFIKQPRIRENQPPKKKQRN